MKSQNSDAFTARDGLTPVEPPDIDGLGKPALVIDPLHARVVRANESAGRLLGLHIPRDGLELDAAMPAVVRLREIACREAATSSAPEMLLFWSPAGVKRLQFDVIKLHDGALQYLLLVAADVAVAAGQQAVDAMAPLRTRPDEEILREIAHQIRLGRQKSEPAATRVGNGPSGNNLTDDRTDGLAPSDDDRPGHFAKLAHELKTPLSAIAAAAEIMRDESFGPIGDARYGSYASGIFESARHALQVVDRMLGERSTAQAIPAQEFAELDINLLLQGSMSPMQVLAGRAGLKLSFAPQPRLPHVVADPVSVRQIVLNLLTNALKFTPTGGAVSLSTHYFQDGPVAIEVRDTGPGIRRDEALRSPDCGSHKRAPRNGSGLGIGLPLVRALAAANGANLIIDSMPGGGTSAGVYFPKDRVIPV